MRIPFGFEPTPQENYKMQYTSRMAKAKHLAERIAHFKKSLEKSTLKEGDKKKILDIFNS